MPAGETAAVASRTDQVCAFRPRRAASGSGGLPDGGARRRTLGLRREEAAVLAGVGASWYQWLEQGRDIPVSPQVLDSVARVLRLSNAERRHLYVLAGLNPPAPRRAGAGRCTPWRGERGRAPYARSMTDSNALDPEDRKIVTLARSARARNEVPEGAAVRDETGRTYVAGTVALDSLKLSALRTAVAMAVASGAKSLEAAAVVTSADSASAEDLAAVRDLGGAGTPVLVAAPDGTVRTTVQAG